MAGPHVKVEPLTLHIIEPEGQEKKDIKVRWNEQVGDGELADDTKGDETADNNVEVTNFSFLGSDDKWGSLVDNDQPRTKVEKDTVAQSAKRSKIHTTNNKDGQDSKHGLNVQNLVECSECGGVFLNGTYLEKHLQKCLVNSDSEGDGDDVEGHQDAVEEEEELGEVINVDSDWDVNADDDATDEEEEAVQFNISTASRKRKLTPASPGHLASGRRGGSAAAKPQDQHSAVISPATWVWKDTSPGGDYKPQDIPFQGADGLRNPLTLPAEPISYFDLYFTEEMIERMYKQTNKYACQYISRYIATLKMHSEVHQWKPTDATEMKTFLGLCILMGLIHKPRVALYWSKDELYNTPIFGQIMSRTRFQLILKFLHFEDNEDEQYDPQDPKRDRLCKVRSITNMLKARLKHAYNPPENITIQQSAVHLKPGSDMKLYTLSTIDGVILDFIISQCNMENSLIQVPGQEWLQTERLALTLLDPYLDKGHTVLAGSWCTTPRLAEYLLKRSTKLVGVMRPDCTNFPKNFPGNDNMIKGSTDFKVCGNILAAKYRANKGNADRTPKIIHVLSTKHSAKMQNTSKKDSHGIPVKKSEALMYYDQNVFNADKVDHQLSSAQVLRKSFKWYHKIFFRLLMMSLFSGHKLYKLQGGKSDFLQFLHDVVLSLVANSPRLTDSSEHAPHDNLIRLSARHFPAQVPYQGNAKAKKNCSKMCRVCYARGKRSQCGNSLKTVWMCLDCPGQPGLCAGECFKAFHTQFDYSQ